MRIAKAHDTSWSFERVAPERVAKLPAIVLRLLDRYACETVGVQQGAGWYLVRDAQDRSTWVIVSDTRTSLAFLIRDVFDEYAWQRLRDPRGGWRVLADLLRDRSAATRCLVPRSATPTTR